MAYGFDKQDVVKNPLTHYGSDSQNKLISYGGFVHVSAYSNQECRHNHSTGNSCIIAWIKINSLCNNNGLQINIFNFDPHWQFEIRLCTTQKNYPTTEQPYHFSRRFACVCWWVDAHYLFQADSLPLSTCLHECLNVSVCLCVLNVILAGSWKPAEQWGGGAIIISAPHCFHHSYTGA